MLMPSIFGENLLDDFFDYSFGSRKTFDMMNTDIKDTESGYEITMNMPGVRKEDVKAELKDGYGWYGNHVFNHAGSSCAPRIYLAVVLSVMNGCHRDSLFFSCFFLKSDRKHEILQEIQKSYHGKIHAGLLYL